MGLSAAIRIAHASSKYGFVFARRGITMESNSSFFLPRLIGYSNSLYLLTTGDVYRGDSKHFGSLFQEVIEDQPGVLKRALELATNIAEKTSALAGFMNRELMWRGKQTAEETHLLDSAVLYHMFAAKFVSCAPKTFPLLTMTGTAMKACKASSKSASQSSRPRWSKTGHRSIHGTVKLIPDLGHGWTPQARLSCRQRTTSGCSAHSLALECWSVHFFTASRSLSIA